LVSWTRLNITLCVRCLSVCSSKLQAEKLTCRSDTIPAVGMTDIDKGPETFALLRCCVASIAT
jgi:hypothetical protein